MLVEACHKLSVSIIDVLLPSADFIKENIIEYFGKCFGFNHGGFKPMIMDPKYLQLDDGASDNEDNEDVEVQNH
jgi:hypothetical protein